MLIVESYMGNPAFPSRAKDAALTDPMAFYVSLYMVVVETALKNDDTDPIVLRDVLVTTTRLVVSIARLAAEVDDSEIVEFVDDALVHSRPDASGVKFDRYPGLVVPWSYDHMDVPQRYYWQATHGPVLWLWIHLTSGQLKVDVATKLIPMLGVFIGCGRCRAHYAIMLGTLFKRLLAVGHHPALVMIDFHNVVNVRLGKPVWKYDDRGAREFARYLSPPPPASQPYH